MVVQYHTAPLVTTLRWYHDVCTVCLYIGFAGWDGMGWDGGEPEDRRRMCRRAVSSGCVPACVCGEDAGMGEGDADGLCGAVLYCTVLYWS